MKIFGLKIDEHDWEAWRSGRMYLGEIDNGLPTGEGRFYSEGDWASVDSYEEVCLKDE